MHKSRFTKENKDVQVLVSHTKGLDRYYGLIDLAEKYGVFKKVSTRYEMPDGSKVFGKQIMKEPKKYFTEDILAQLDEYAKQEYMYGNEVDEVEMAEESND
jgi:phosphoserine phosphatase